MGLSHRTIERYMDNIRKKTGLRKKGEILKLGNVRLTVSSSNL